MRWQQTEFIFKGMYLGMLLFVGLVLREPDWWRDMAQVGVQGLDDSALARFARRRRAL